VFDGLLYINIPRLSHNGMENPRTTIKKYKFRRHFVKISKHYFA